MTRQIQVQLGERSYAVSVGAGLLAELGPAVAALSAARQAVVVSDSNVAALYGARAADSLRRAGLGTELLTFPAGEANKTLATCSNLYDSLFALRPAMDRRTVLVALGGGVTGDITGFVAATALRGLRFVQCPTTLLAAVDASVGGKTGVDHPAGKNLIGAFHQPSAVLVDVDLLKTLSPAEFAGGLAECVKHAVIGGSGLGSTGFQPVQAQALPLNRQYQPPPAQVENLCHQSLMDFLETRREAVLARDPECLTELIARNVAIKAAVVSADERESGQREHLNFGHTIGHATENLVGYGAISHGQAVSLGMVAACRLAVARGLLDAASAGRVEKLLVALGLPVRWPGLSAAALWEIMRHDKKARGGKVRMVLPVRLGEVASFEDITEQAVAGAVDCLRVQE
jgi:3-dehydroquinate synthase